MSTAVAACVGRMTDETAGWQAASSQTDKTRENRIRTRIFIMRLIVSQIGDVFGGSITNLRKERIEITHLFLSVRCEMTVLFLSSRPILSGILKCDQFPIICFGFQQKKVNYARLPPQR